MYEIVFVGNMRNQNQGLVGSVYGWGGVLQPFGPGITKSQ